MKILYKPSVLTQCKYLDSKSPLVAFDFKVINALYYYIWNNILDKITHEDLNSDICGSYYINIYHNDINDIIGSKSEFRNIYHSFERIKKTDIEMNYLSKDKKNKYRLTSIINSITLTEKESKWDPQEIKLAIDNEIMRLLLSAKSEEKIMYTEIDLDISFEFKTKQSILLFEFLNDYSGGWGNKNLTFDKLKELVHSNKPTYKGWSRFNNDILVETIEEINLITPLTVSYEPVLGRVKGRQSVSEIKFDIKIEKQAKKVMEKAVDKERKHIDNATKQKALKKLSDKLKNGGKVTNVANYLDTTEQNLAGSGYKDYVESDVKLDTCPEEAWVKTHYNKTKYASYLKELYKDREFFFIGMDLKTYFITGTNNPMDPNAFTNLTKSAQETKEILEKI